jgi:hypothetical protein
VFVEGLSVPLHRGDKTPVELFCGQSAEISGLMVKFYGSSSVSAGGDCDEVDHADSGLARHYSAGSLRWMGENKELSARITAQGTTGPRAMAASGAFDSHGSPPF